MAETKLLILGSSSLVGSHFIETYGPKYEICALGRRNIFEGTDLLASFSTTDIQDESKIREAIKLSDARVVINYAAETNVDLCEKEKNDKDGRVYSTNTRAVSWIAESCKETDKILYHISTDFVFDGTQGPYSETDETGPIRTDIGWYGYTKYLAEKLVIERIPNSHCIIRMSYPYRANFELKTDFARTILNLFQRQNLFPLFTDQIFSPTLVDDITAATDYLISNNARGIYHVACKDPTTPFDFAQKLLSVFYPNTDAIRLKTASILDFNKIQGRAPRPVKGGLRTDKIANVGFPPRSVEDAIMDFHRQTVQSS